MGKILAPMQTFSLDGTVQLDIGLLAVLGGGLGVVLGLLLLPRVMRSITSQVLPDKFKLIYDKTFYPFIDWIGSSLLFLVGNIVLIITVFYFVLTCFS